MLLLSFILNWITATLYFRIFQLINLIAFNLFLIALLLLSQVLQTFITPVLTYLHWLKITERKKLQNSDMPNI
jgi:Mn2+/Fe2+ NRAMP family transporter